MKYCVTGGSGFIGTHICRSLKEQGQEVVVLDLIDPPAHHVHDRFVKGDVRDPDACRAALEGCDRVIHLAAAHHDFGIDEPTFYAVNEQGTRVLTEAMDEHGVRTIKLFVDKTQFESARIREAGFQPSVPLAEGIRRMVEWYQAKGRLESAEWHQPPAEIVRFEREPVGSGAGGQ